jgi:hypothetical protein
VTRYLTLALCGLVCLAGTSFILGPAPEVAAINKAINARPELEAACKQLVASHAAALTDSQHLASPTQVSSINIQQKTQRLLSVPIVHCAEQFTFCLHCTWYVCVFLNQANGHPTTCIQSLTEGLSHTRCQNKHTMWVNNHDTPTWYDTVLNRSTVLCNVRSRLT